MVADGGNTMGCYSGLAGKLNFSSHESKHLIKELLATFYDTHSEDLSDCGIYDGEDEVVTLQKNGCFEVVAPTLELCGHTAYNIHRAEDTITELAASGMLVWTCSDGCFEAQAHTIKIPVKCFSVVVNLESSHGLSETLFVDEDDYNSYVAGSYTGYVPDKVPILEGRDTVNYLDYYEQTMSESYIYDDLEEIFTEDAGILYDAGTCNPDVSEDQFKVLLEQFEYKWRPYAKQEKVTKTDS